MIFRVDLPHAPVIKRSVCLRGRETSVSLEDPFWHKLKAIATARGKTLCDLISDIDRTRPGRNLSSTLRIFVLTHREEGNDDRRYKG